MLLKRLGIGGFGEVWHGQNRHLNSRVGAFKFCLDPQSQEWLIRHEANMIDQVMHLDDPGVVKLIDVDFNDIGDVMVRQALNEAKQLTKAMASISTPSMIRSAYTPLYASPQQIAGQASDPRDDVHALGVMFYQMLQRRFDRGLPKMEFVWIAPGKFMMGAPDSDIEAYDSEQPQHELTLSQGFYLGKFAVTRGQFAEFVKESGHKAANDWQNPEIAQSNDHPVVNVSR